MPPSRADDSLLGRWWWSVDRATLVAVAVLIGCGYVMMLAASPAVAVRIGDARDALMLKQVVFLALAGLGVVVISMLSPRNVRQAALAGLVGALLLTAATLAIGVTIKGARRWIELPGLAVQPSEFLKPTFAVTAAWLIAEGRRRRFPGAVLAALIFAVIAALLVKQPDFGMLAVITAVFLAQLFVGGLPLAAIGIGLCLMLAAGVTAFELVPHVHSRVVRFLHPTEKNAYQVIKSLQAFGNGGLWGRGAGEGQVKDMLPDAHADFVYAVAGEEFGFVACLFILATFAFVVVRALLRLLREHDMFVILAASGLAASFGLQAFVNMASALELIPAKGMTLPFISYGGSSVLSVALEIGFLLALTRSRTHGDAP